MTATQPRPGATATRLLDDGYAVEPALFTPEQVGEVAGLLLPLFERWSTLGGRTTLDLGRPGSAIPEILHPSVHEPRLRQTGVYRGLHRIAAELWGPGTHFRFDHSINKPAGCPLEVSWHQDRANKRSHLPERRVQFWVPLQPVGVDGGCMRYVPGSHRGGLLRHVPVPGRRNGKTVVGQEMTGGVDCPLPVGGVAMHLIDTLHASGPNRSGTDRVAWIVQFTHPRLGLPPLSAIAHRLSVQVRFAVPARRPPAVTR